MATAQRRIEDFFGRPALDVAADLLGSTVRCGAVVVELTEVEAYGGAADPASHAFRGPTARNRVMFGPSGHVYVYFSYGMHHCMNLVCDAPGSAAAVLLRAGRVVAGVEEARSCRGASVADAALARGPGNLTRALGVSLECSGTTLWDGPVRWEPNVGPAAAPYRAGPRVGVSAAADEPWRLWVPGEPSVSAYRRSSRAARAAVAPLPRRSGTAT